MRYGKNEKREAWIIRCGYCGKRGSSDVVPWSSLPHFGKIIKSWLRFLPFLVNNQFNRPNIVIVKNGEWILKSQTSQINIICPWRKLIAWIKIFRRIWLTYTQRSGGSHFFDLLLCGRYYAYQIYHQSHWNPGEYRLDAFGFRRAIVDAYYHLYKKSLPSTLLFTGRRSLHYPANNFQFGGINHWIAKSSQQRCSLSGCKGTSVYYCKKKKKCNVSLYAKCLELYHCK